MKVTIIDPSCFSMPYDHCLCEALTQEGCEVYLIGSRYLYSSWKHSVSYHKVNHFYTLTNWLYKNKPKGPFRKMVKALEHIINMYSLIKYLQKVKPNVIHFQWIPFPFFDRLFVRRMKKIAPTILTVHDVFPYHNTPSSKIQLISFRTTVELFDHLIVHTRSSLQSIINRLDINENMVSVIPHGVFSHYFQNTSTKKEVFEKKIVLFFGTIKPYKGIDTLIRALGKLDKEDLEDITCLIAGIPMMDITPLQDLADTLKISKSIQWRLGYIPEDQVGSILKLATVFVFPYKDWEAQSGALMATLPFGKPIVATNISGFEETLVDGVHGYVVESKNPAALAYALKRILDNPKRSKNMGKAVKKLAQNNLSWISIARKTTTLYRKLSTTP